MRGGFKRGLWLASTAVVVGGLAAGQGRVVARAAPGVFMSSNVGFVKNIPTGAAAIGGRVIGNRFYLTSYQDVEIFDISTPTDPKLLGSVPVNVERENEEVTTNGKVLAVSSSMGCQYMTPSDQPAPADGRWEGTPVSCLELFDVRDPAHPTLLTHVMGAGQHTSTCIYDCQYIWGQYGGEVTDLRHLFDANHPAPIIGNWMDNLPTIPVRCPNTGGDQAATHSCNLAKIQCHNVTEVAPGLMFAACDPVLLLSVRPEDGGTVTHPRLLSYGIIPDGRFIHGTQWARGGQDRFALVGGETNGVPRCDRQTNAAFMTWVRDPAGVLREVAEFHLSDGTYSDGNPPVHTLGCSVHWFHEHPTFHDGGLVSLAAYDNGNRFVQVKPDGKIVDQGFFTRVNAATWASYWAPDQRTVYVVDDYYGLDVVRWNGPFYVPASGTAAAQVTAPTSAPAAAAAAPADSLPTTAAPRLVLSWVDAALVVVSAVAAGVASLRRRRARRA